ncbi:MAG TPA: GNAT family N-acetyltransferase [Candidatus Limnocylindrales bacterium]|nr:GNAT family N-acetyltransferase [Candidatus Limnocylindrales bacterium]
MKAPELKTKDASIKLIEPNVERDAELGVQWLNGESGRATLRSMGNTEEVIDTMLPATLEQEAERVRSFLVREDQLNWMIEYEGNVIGSVWVNLGDSKEVPGPSVHIMIGDPEMRGKGVGGSAISAVLEYLEEQGNKGIYSRHLTSNEGADKLLQSLGFVDVGEPYLSDSLEFQNLMYINAV